MGTADLKVTKDMQMGDLLAAYPGAQGALFQGFHIGGCSSCGFSETDTLEAVCRTHELDPDTVVEHLRRSQAVDQELQISPREVAACLRQGALKLLDIRDEEDRRRAAIRGAIPVTQELVQEILSTWPKDTFIVLHCHHGHTSLDAASYLLGHGFTNVRSMTGGIDAWSLDVDPGIPRY